MPVLKSITLAALGALAVSHTVAADVWIQTSTWSDSNCKVKALDYTSININQMLLSQPSTKAFAGAVTDCKVLTTLMASAGSLITDPSQMASVSMLVGILNGQGKCTPSPYGPGAGYTTSSCASSKPNAPVTGSPFLVNTIYSSDSCGTALGEMAVVADNVCRPNNFAILGLSGETYSCAAVTCNASGNTIRGYYPDNSPTVTATDAHLATLPTDAPVAARDLAVTSKLVAGATNNQYASLSGSGTCAVSDNAMIGAVFGNMYSKYTCNTSGAPGNGFSLITASETKSFQAIDNTPQTLAGGASLTFRGANGAPVDVLASSSPRDGVPVPAGAINSYWTVDTTASGFTAEFALTLSNENLKNFGYKLDNLKWAYNNDSSDTWTIEKSSVIDKSTGKVSVNVSHFSTWTVVSTDSSVAKILPSAVLAAASLAAAVFFGF